MNLYCIGGEVDGVGILGGRSKRRGHTSDFKRNIYYIFI